MPIDLNGRYWKIYELEKVTGLRANQLRKALENLEGPITVGPSILVPDRIVSSLRGLVQKKKNRPLAAATVANRLRCGITIINELPEKGFPAIKTETTYLFDQVHIPPLEKAMNEIRAEKGKMSILFIDELVSRSMQYMKEAKNGNTPH